MRSSVLDPSSAMKSIGPNCPDFPESGKMKRNFLQTENFPFLIGERREERHVHLMELKPSCGILSVC